MAYYLLIASDIRVVHRYSSRNRNPRRKPRGKQVFHIRAPSLRITGRKRQITHLPLLFSGWSCRFVLLDCRSVTCRWLPKLTFSLGRVLRIRSFKTLRIRTDLATPTFKRIDIHLDRFLDLLQFVFSSVCVLYRYSSNAIFSFIAALAEFFKFPRVGFKALVFVS